MSSIFSTETNDIETAAIRPNNGLLEAAALETLPTAYGLDFNSSAESSATAPSLIHLALDKINLEGDSLIHSDSLLLDFVESNAKYHATAVHVDDLTGIDDEEATYSQTAGETASANRFSGSLDYSDDLNPTRQGAFKDDYILSRQNTTTVQLNLESPSFDTYLQLIDGSTGELLIYDDDSGTNTNSQLTFTAQAGQQYAVRVTSYGSYATGGYDLTAYFDDDQPDSPNDPSNEFSSVFGYGLVDAASAVAAAIGQSPFSEVADIGGNQWNNDMINAPEAWNQGYTGEGVTVAVIDSGVDINHEDLRDNIWENTGEIYGDGIDNDGNGYVDDRYGWNFGVGQYNPDVRPGTDDPGQSHGTHVAGTIAAGNNGFGMTGVAHGADIMAIRMGDSVGTSYSNPGDLAEAIYYAVDNGADVINMSLSINGSSDGIEQALAYAAERNVITVTSAGNNSRSEPNFPARYATNYGISVGAVTPVGEIASFSNWAGSDSQMHHVVAPGTEIYSTLPGSTWGNSQGTSMSAPHVAGVVALMLSANRNLTHAQVREILTSTTFSAAATSQIEQTYNAQQEVPAWTMSTFPTETSRWNSFDAMNNRTPVSLAEPVYDQSEPLLSEMPSAKVMSEFLLEQSAQFVNSYRDSYTDRLQQEVIQPLIKDDLLIGVIA